MAAVEKLRNLINERLTAATEEILGVFVQTLSAYEEEINRHRRLLDTLRPEIKLHRIELPQQHVCKGEEVLAEQQLCIQEGNSSPDQEDPEPPQIKEEQKEPCISQEGEQLVLKEETGSTLLLDLDPAAEKEPPDDISPQRSRSESDRESPGGPGQNSDCQLYFHTSHIVQNQDHTSDNHVKPSDKPFKCNSCSKDFYLYTHLKVHMTSHIAEKPFWCTVCGKGFSFKRNLIRHMKTHSGERPYACDRCMRTFGRFEHLQVHIRSHTGEKPYSCVYCAKALSGRSALAKHVRLHTELPQQHVYKEEEVLTDQQFCIQERNSLLDQEDPEPPQIGQEGEQLVLKQEIGSTLLLDLDQAAPLDSVSPDRSRSESDGESSGGPGPNSDHQHISDNQDHTSGNHVKPSDKPFKCNSCSKDFYLYTHLKVHMTSHTAEKPFICSVCGKGFSFKRNLIRHMKTHSGEKPYACDQCVRTFRRFEHLQVHIRSHTGEKPYSCVYCDKTLSRRSALAKHIRMHTGENL